MYIDTKNVCRVLGFHETDWITIRRVFQPDLVMTTERRKNGTRPRKMWATNSLIKWFDAASGTRLSDDIIRQLFEASVIIREPVT